MAESIKGLKRTAYCGTFREEHAGQEVTVGTDLLYRVGETTVGIEICEDLFAPVAPSVLQCLNGAEVILNLAASPEQAGKKTVRADRVKNQSAACKCIYA